MTEAAAVYFEDRKEASDLGRLAVRGGIVSVAMQYGNGVLQLAAAFVLTRLFAPEDFGLVAIVTVLTSSAPFLIDFGLGDATTQENKLTQSQAGFPSGATGVAAAVVMTSLLLAVPSISYAGCPIGAACGGWWFQTTALTHYSGLVRIFLSTGICVSIYLIMVACFGIPSRLRSQSQSCGIFWEGDSGGQSYARG